MNSSLLYRFLLALTFLFLAQIISAQDPSFYTIGENELNEIDIYSLLESRDGNLYIASNDGLYRYANGSFFKFPKLDIQKGNSLFFLVENTNGEIFCSNLKGQVFKVSNDTLTLFYTVDKEYLVHLPYLLTDNLGNLFVVAKRISVFSEDTTKYIYDFLSVDKNVDGDVVVVVPDNRFYIYPYIDSTYSLSFQKGIKSEYRSIITKRSRQKDQISYKIPKCIFEEFDKNITTTMALDSSTFWTRKKTFGIKVNTVVDNRIDIEPIIYDNTFISAFTKGHSGLLYMGTFKQGIRIVPNANVNHIYTPFKRRSIIDFDLRSEDEFILFIRGKGLVQYRTDQNEYNVIDEHYGNQGVFCLPDQKISSSNLYYDVFIQNDNGNKQLGGVKSIFPISHGDNLYATSRGLLRVCKDGHKLSDDWMLDTEFGIYEHKALKDRCIAVVMDKHKEVIYTATQSKLLAVYEDRVEEIKYMNQSIMANSLYLNKDQLIIGSQQFGVISYHNDVVSVLYNSKSGLADNNVIKLDKTGSLIFVLNSNFLQAINLHTDKIIPLGKAEGVVGYINNFYSWGDYLYILTDNSTIHKLPLNDISCTDDNINLVVDSLRMNESLISQDKVLFNYDENSFEFNYRLSSDAHREQSVIEYYLEGFDHNPVIVPATSQSIDYKKLPPGNYQFRAIAKYGDKSSEPFVYDFIIKQPFWKRWWFIVACILLSILAVYLYFRNRLRVHRLEVQKKLIQKQTETDLINAKLTALRSQMNPHFIFNALNSIQNLILKADTERSYDYIVLFSKLVRSTLNYSEQEYISLDDEVEFLEVYLQLEKLRFDEDFVYRIENRCEELISIPPLIIQPFVENALLHGLLSKKGNKELNIIFDMEGSRLMCTIVDNGIGRARSKEIQVRQGRERKSFALNALQKRLDIMQKQYEHTIGYEFIDLYDQDQALGTKVIIYLPYK